MVETGASAALVIIPCLNEEAHLARVLRQLKATAPDSSFHFLIVDGGSRDRTREIAKSFTTKHDNIEYLENARRIQSAAINLAVETRGKNYAYLIRIDAHADYPPDYCQILLDEAEKTGAGSVVVAMHTVGKTDFQRGVAAAQNSKLGNGGSAHRNAGANGRWIDHGHHALMRIAAFHEVGGYDESFSHNEDAELDMRLRQKNYRIWLTGKTAVTYYPRATALSLLLQYRGYGYGRACTILKHRMRPALRQMLPAFVAPALLLFFFSFCIPYASLPLFVWMVVCLGYGCKLAYDAEDITLAWSGPAALLMHLGWSLGFWQAMIQKAGRAKWKTL